MIQRHLGGRPIQDSVDSDGDIEILGFVGTGGCPTHCSLFMTMRQENKFAIPMRGILSSLTRDSPGYGQASDFKAVFLIERWF
jgi:hypothetical protein